MEDNRRSRSPSDESESKKRFRSSNFSSQERNVLIHIIEKYQEVVESKRLDRRSITERDLIWDIIATEFNELSLNEPVRTRGQLKQCYENLKRKIKKENNLLDDSRSPNFIIDPLMFRSCIIEANDDSNSSLRHGDNASYQESSDGAEEYRPESRPITVYHNVSCGLAGEEMLHRDSSTENLQRSLLKKQIESAMLDFEMKTKKYDLELRVEQAKLDYYKKKCELLNITENGNRKQSSDSNRDVSS